MATVTTPVKPINNREFLFYLLIVTIVFVAFSFVFWLFWWLVAESGRESPWLSLGPIDQYPVYIYEEVPPTKVHTDQFSVWVAHLEDQVLLLDGRTNHALADSYLGGCYFIWNIATSRFEDPCYGSKYRVDGTLIEGPGWYDLLQYETKITADGILMFRVTGYETSVCRDFRLAKRGESYRYNNRIGDESPPLCENR